MLQPAEDFGSWGPKYIMKRVVSLIYVTPTVLIFASTKYYQLGPVEDFCFRGDKYITKKVRVLSLACDMPSDPLSLPNINKIPLWVSELWSIQGCAYISHPTTKTVVKGHSAEFGG